MTPCTKNTTQQKEYIFAHLEHLAQACQAAVYDRLCEAVGRNRNAELLHCAHMCDHPSAHMHTRQRHLEATSGQQHCTKYTHIQNRHIHTTKRRTGPLQRVEAVPLG